jgi:hypothetical protein
MGEAIAIGGAVAAIAGIGIQAYGAYKTADAQEKAAEDAARISRSNQQAAEKAAAQSLERGSFEAGLIRQKGTKLVAAQRSRYAAGGIDVTGGSALEVQAETAYLSDLDARTTALNAALEAWGYRKQGATFSAQAAAQIRAGQNASSATLLGGAGSAIGQGAQLVNQYQQAQYQRSAYQAQLDAQTKGQT